MLHYDNITIAGLPIILAIGSLEEVTNRLRTLSRGYSMNQFTIVNTHTIINCKNLHFLKERHAM